LYNAQRLAEYLEAHPNVAWVSYLGLASHPYHEQAKKLLHGFGCVLSFGVKGGRGDIVVDNLRLHSSLANIGTVHSLVVHPATTTHAQLSPADRIAAGVTPDLLRVSVGTEHIDDIIEDFEEAFAVLRKVEAQEAAVEAEAQ
jgi:O-acetylhomoserine/O-acetylserine sulfhydrylase-like pyridoxal-dependent enzyme